MLLATATAEMTREELARHEQVIERGKQTFVEVGLALWEIREGRGYRFEHGTFEDYCQERWGWGRNYANKLISASAVVGNLGTVVPILPVSETQARPLTQLAPDQQREAWQKAVETAPNGKVTAAHVEHVVDEFRLRVHGIVRCGTCGNLYDGEKFTTWCPYCIRGDRSSDEIKGAHVAHNTGESEWYTPVEYIAAARKVLGAIDLDPASCEIANATVRATKFYSVEEDGLSKEWRGRVWMNPPYTASLVSQFAEKLAEGVEQGRVTAAIVLVNNATETKWFARLAQVASAFCFPTGRVRFLDPQGNPGAPLQGQAIIYVGKKPDTFIEQFKAFGWCAVV